MPNPSRARAAEVVEAATFKRVGDGFVFRTPGIWPLVRARHFRVSGIEKDAILERLNRRRTRGVLLAFGVWLVLVAAATASIALLTRHDDPTIPDVLVLFAFALISLLLCLQAQAVLVMRPMTAGLTETPEQFPFRERLAAARGAVKNASPFPQPLLLAVLYAVGCAANVFAFLLRTHGTRSSALWNGQSFSALFLAVLLGGLAVRFFYLDFVEARRRAAAASDVTTGFEKDPLIVRLEQVETESRRLRRALASIAALACLLGVGAAAAAGLLLGGVWGSAEAGRFVLRNARGDIAALLATDKDNAATLSLFGPDKTLRMLLGVTSSGSPQFALYGPEQALRLVLGLARDGLPVVRLNGSDAKSRMGFVVNSSNAVLTLSDPQGTTRLSLSADPAGGHLKVLDAQGNEQRHE